jgi:primosomal protein N' (replication factor Y)
VTATVAGPAFVDVALDLPLDRAFTYRVPAGLAGLVRVGARVRVPFRGRVVSGLVSAEREACDLEGVRDVTSVARGEDALPDDLLRLGAWISRYYGCALGEALAAMVPRAIRPRGKARGRKTVRLKVEPAVAFARAELLRETENPRARCLRMLAEAPGGALPLLDLRRRAKVSESPLRTLAKEGLVSLEEGAAPEPASAVEEAATVEVAPAPAVPEATPAQVRAVEAVSSALGADAFAAFLLLGVTGSGKTEVYLRAIEACRASGRQAIVLVPEIALTPQTVRRFRERFARVAVLHSAMGEAARGRAWRAARSGAADVVVGPRSAVFAPVPRLGLVVVDEEHETSYKQQNAPRYHARDVALVRARAARAVVVLGSATPSLESYRHALDGRYRLLELPERVGGRPMPPVTLVDLRRDGERRGPGTRISRTLANRLGETLGRGEQAILFLNRRGFSTSVSCPRCGFVARCPACDVALTYHRSGAIALCHHCGHEARSPTTCPDCAFPALRHRGAGTESIEEEIRSLFPNATVARMDSDTMATSEDYERTLDRFARGEVSVLLGTQMIAKGLDFPRVTLAAVVSADTALAIPDFRAAERAFALVEQVAGRAGRGDAGGEVVVQTTRPDEAAIRLAVAHDYAAFAALEIEERRAHGHPPWRRLLRVVVRSKRAEAAQERARALADLLAADPPPGVEWLGPAIPPAARLAGWFRRHLLIKGDDAGAVRRALDRLRAAPRPGKGVDEQFDVDPVDAV